MSQIKMSFLELQTILWRGNELSFLPTGQPSGVLLCFRGHPLGIPAEIPGLIPQRGQLGRGDSAPLG